MISVNTMKLKLLPLLYLLLISEFAISAESNFYYNQISLKEGLSQSTVKAVYRDHIGMLWIGTKSGLNRYDGSTVQTFYHNSSEPYSLPDDDIFFITEDRDNNLWIGTGGCLCRYDRRTNTFEKKKFDGREVSFRSALLIGEKLYFSSSNMLVEYNGTSGKWRKVNFSGVKNNLSILNKMERWRNGTILIGSRSNGLFICDPSTGKLTRTPFCTDEMILDIYRDSQERLWISVYGKGIMGFNQNGKMICSYNPVQSPLSSDKVMDIEEVNGLIWLATDGKGIDVFSPETQRFLHLEHAPDNPFSLPVNSINVLYKDAYGNLWLGSIRGGIFGVKEVFIQSYLDAPLNSRSGLSERTVLSFYEDPDNTLWIGTDGGGINKFDPDSRRFTHFPATYGKKVSNITLYSADKLLVSLYKEGLMLFDKQAGLLTPFPLKNESGELLFKNEWLGINVQNTGHGDIIISSDKLYCYSIAEKKVQQLQGTVNGDGELRLITLRNGNLLVYGISMVYLLDVQSKKIKPVCKINKTSMGSLNAIAVDAFRQLWIGTSLGLYQWKSESHRFNKVGSGLFRGVSSIVSGTDSSLWIGTNLELFRYRIKQGEFYSYEKSDGVNPNEFLPRSRLCSRTGDIYMGGVAGFLHIDKDIPVKTDKNPTVELLEVKLDGRQVESLFQDKPAGYKKITIPWDYTSLVFSLFSNTPDLTSRKRLRYNIGGYSTLYKEVEKQSVQLQNLPPGTYKLQVEYELKNAQWSPPTELLKIVVLPPWWRTWWFYLLCTLGLIMLLWWIRINAVRRAVRAMEQEMQQHEKDIYEQKVKFLVDVSHELRTPLTLVYSPLRRLMSEPLLDQSLIPTLNIINKHVRYMKNTIDMVLDVSRLESKEDVMNLSNYKVNEWIRSVVDDFRLEFESREIKLIYDLDEKVDEIVFDGGKCQKVLSNLLMNAIKFSDRHSGIQIKSQLLQKSVRISVTDEGPGIAQEDLDRVFDRFYQGQHAKGGTGIGLSFCKAQIELHGGAIGAERGSECGSEFWFELPLDLQSSPQVAQIVPVLSQSEEPSLMDNKYDLAQLQNLTLLIVEDNEDLRSYLYDALREVFKKVYKASDGEKGLDLIRQYMPDLVVSDVMMPNMDGFEMCRQIKTDINVSHIPVVLLTALNDEAHSITGYKMGADVYLSKPFAIDLLITVIRNLLASRNELKLKYGSFSKSVLPKDITFSNADERFISRFIELIESRLDDTNLDIEKLAGEMAMSRSSFYSKMKALTGMGVNTFIIDFKVRKAMELLKQTDLPIVEISSQLGFVSQRYFSTVFKNVSGKTPTEYRQS